MSISNKKKLELSEALNKDWHISLYRGKEVVAKFSGMMPDIIITDNDLIPLVFEWIAKEAKAPKINGWYLLVRDCKTESFLEAMVDLIIEIHKEKLVET